MSFQLEVVNQKLLDEMAPLFEKHYREISHYQDIPLDPDYGQYLKMAECGVIRCFSSRDEDGTLLGYAVYFIKHNIHYRSSLQAVQDVLFIDPIRRGHGMRFIKFCDDQLRAEGVQVVYHHVKEAHNFGPMLERMDYKLVDLIFAKRLDK